MSDSISESQSSGASSKRILIVDDETDAVEVLKILLTLEGHQVQTASDGKSALETAGGFQPEVVLLSTGLRDLTTREVAEHIRRELPQALLVALVSWREEKDVLGLKEEGFNTHMTKPVKVEDVLALLQRK